jgi:hypothetical protein
MSQAQERKRDLRAAAEEAKEKQRAHEERMTKMILDWVATVTPKRGDIVVLTVPTEYFVWPGTDPEDVTEEQSEMMETCHKVLGTLLQGVMQQGILPGGAAILGEGMSLSDLPPPWEKHPDARSPIAIPNSRIVLPPGTKF